VGKKDEDDDFFKSDDDADEEEFVEEVLDDEEAVQLAVDAVKKFIKETPEFSDEELLEYITNQQMASALKSHEKCRILVQAAFTKNFFQKKEIQLFSPAIVKITNGNRIMERHLIAALEVHCVKKPKNFPVMLKLLYDEDALAEETILEWADQGRSKLTLDAVDEETRAKLRGEAEPLVTWLQEAESEGESDDESE
jgi:translation initiation factor 5